jgi:fibronectin type 3 domain-containing protein
MEISQDVSISVNSLQLNKATGGNVTLTWTAPSHDSSVAINKYHVYRRASVTSLWILIAEPTPTTNSLLDPVLNDGGPWQYKVTAVVK